MEIIVRFDGDDEVLTLKVKRVYNHGAINNFGLESVDYAYFQYDSHDRPSDYSEEFREKQWFNGYLIGRKNSLKAKVTECQIQVRYGK